MAASPVNAQTVTLTAGGVLVLVPSVAVPTGSGIYTVECFGGANGQVLTGITGGSGHAMITLHPGTVGEYFYLAHNGTTIVLEQGQDFAPASIYDRITLRLTEAGTAWVEEITRAHF
jgi:hypothetical protein